MAEKNERHMIQITVLRSQFRAGLDTSVRDILSGYRGMEFNCRHAHISYVTFRPDYDCFEVFLTHSEFPPVAEGGCCMNYSPERARNRFPFLFVDTDPILWRRF